MLLSFVLMKIEALWNGVFEITGRQTWCLIFLAFLLLVVFTGSFPKTLRNNYPFLRSTILPSFTISNLLLLKWLPFQYNTKLGKKNRIYWCFDQAFVKNFMKKILFLIQISKVHARIYRIANFHDLKLSATKITAVSI